VIKFLVSFLGKGKEIEVSFIPNGTYRHQLTMRDG
jgi:hypothetical protein